MSLFYILTEGFPTFALGTVVERGPDKETEYLKQTSCIRIYAAHALQQQLNEKIC